MNFIQKWRINSKCSNHLLPDFVCQYYQAAFQSDFKNKNYADLRFVVLDTETTGLNTSKDFVLSIGAITIEQKRIQVKDSFEVVLQNSCQSLDADTVKIHGLTMSDIKNGANIQDVVQDFLAYLKADIIVAHHAAFDVTMLNKTVSKAIQQPFELINPVLDTAHLARRLDSFENPYEMNLSYRLDDLCRRFDIGMHDRHTAWGDALITAKLFLILTRKLEARGNKTLKDLMRPAMKRAF